MFVVIRCGTGSGGGRNEGEVGKRDDGRVVERADGRSSDMDGGGGIRNVLHVSLGRSVLGN
jgi:hypothetical protein